MNTGLDFTQVRDLVVRPTLVYLDLWSQEAEDLVLGTAVHESRLRYIKQIKGPALGLFQMEPATYADHQERFLLGTELGVKVNILASVLSKANRPYPHSEELIYNMRFAAALCRVHYLRRAPKLPKDPAGLAQTAKNVYNTQAGKATVEDYLQAIEYAKGLA